jgi:hypothetical protein
MGGSSAGMKPVRSAIQSRATPRKPAVGITSQLKMAAIALISMGEIAVRISNTLNMRVLVFLRRKDV